MRQTWEKAALLEKCGTLGKVRHTWKNAAHLKKMRRTWKNEQHLEECAKTWIATKFGLRLKSESLGWVV